MRGEDQIRNALLKRQIAKMCSNNQNVVPVYLIINNQKDTQVPQIPIKFYSKQLLLKDLVADLHQNYQKYAYIYLFGKEDIDNQEQMSLKHKRKLKNKPLNQTQSHEPKVMAINQQNQNNKIGEMHHLYKDNNHLLVVVISQKSLITKPKVIYYDWIFITLAVLCVIIYLILCFSRDSINQHQRDSL